MDFRSFQLFSWPSSWREPTCCEFVAVNRQVLDSAVGAVSVAAQELLYSLKTTAKP